MCHLQDVKLSLHARKGLDESDRLSLLQSLQLGAGEDTPSTADEVAVVGEGEDPRAEMNMQVIGEKGGEWPWPEVEIDSDQGLDPEDGFSILHIPQDGEEEALDTSSLKSTIDSGEGESSCAGQMSQAGEKALVGGRCGLATANASAALCVQVEKEEDVEECFEKADSIARSYLYRMSMRLAKYQDFLCEFQDRCSLALQVHLGACFAIGSRNNKPLPSTPVSFHGSSIASLVRCTERARAQELLTDAASLGVPRARSLPLGSQPLSVVYNGYSQRDPAIPPSCYARCRSCEARCHSTIYPAMFGYRLLLAL